jgi:hypothetical protein
VEQEGGNLAGQAAASLSLSRNQRRKLMPTAFRNIERAREELGQLHRELLQLEKRVDSSAKPGVQLATAPSTLLVT